MTGAIAQASVEVQVSHGRMNVARAGEGADAVEVKSNASGRGVAEIAAAKCLGCESWQVVLTLRHSGDSVSGKPSIFEARRKS